MEGWLDYLRLYVLFTSISVISVRCVCDYERLYVCNGTRLRFLQRVLNPGPLDQQPALSVLSHTGVPIQNHFSFAHPQLEGRQRLPIRGDIPWMLSMHVESIGKLSCFSVIFYKEDQLSRPRGYKTFFMLNSVEHEIFPAHKC